MLTIDGGRVAPRQTIVIDEDNPSQHPPVIDSRLSMRLRTRKFPTCHLRVAQPEKIAHVTAAFSSHESRGATKIDAS